MSGETMREAVEAALKELIEGVRPREPVTYAMAADAAIRTVLERLREVTPAMRTAGLDACGGDGSCLYAWDAMLDAAAREVG